MTLADCDGDVHPTGAVQTNAPPTDGRETVAHAPGWLRQHRRSLLLGIVQTGLPIAISVAALLIAVFTYEDDNRTYVATVAAARIYQAERVSFAIVSDHPSDFGLVVSNNSVAPASHVLLTVQYNFPHSIKGGKVYLLLGEIPACSVGYVPVKQGLQQAGLHRTLGGLIVYRMFFTDNTGTSWEYTMYGFLKRVAMISESGFANYYVSVSPNYKLAAGCT